MFLKLIIFMNACFEDVGKSLETIIRREEDKGILSEELKKDRIGNLL